MIPSPIVVLSFGRSGSTWVSDIISKNLGGLLLFEPFHPQVCPFAHQVCYSDGFDPDLDEPLQTFLRQILEKKYRDRWLLRNHLFSPLEAVSQAYVDMVWQESRVLGFKEIRANYMIDWLIQRLGARIVYLVRHPAAVIASLRRRKNFWNEFGFETHWELFLAHVVHHPRYEAMLAPYGTWIHQARTQLQRETIMWAVSHKLASHTLARYHLPIFYYEDLYQHPYPTVRRLITYLGGNPERLHPAHIFVPSMTTIRTVHGLTASESDFAHKGWRIFWEDILTPHEYHQVMTLIQAFDLDVPYGRWDTDVS